MIILLKSQNSKHSTKTPWTTGQISILKRLYHKGISHHKIAQRLNRTVDSIQKALLRFEIRKTRNANEAKKNL
jgi:DNA-binding NarL/FixJ family response regulator